MNIFTKTVGFLAVLCAIEPCVAALRAGGATQSATSRISVATTSGTAAARRLPTLLKTATTTTDTTSGDSSLLGRDDCIEQYTECVKEADICGPNFEECTTAELFYAKKPQCNGVLLQCGAAGISALFGTSSITDLSADNMYTYPTGGSLIGQYIEAGHLGNLYDTATCVKRVTSCFNKESVCGSEFELCTSNNEFKKQRVFCESNIARCQEDGIRELFGSTDASSIPTATSRLGILITEGAELAAANAVNTCHKVADQCILNACKANPYKCIKDSSTWLVNLTDSVKKGLSLTKNQTSTLNEQLTSASVNSYIRGECLDTIGGNKYCYMTTFNGEVPTASQLTNEDKREEIYDDIYAWSMNVNMQQKIQDLANEFDRETKNKCSDTITACAMRSCGGGLGSACFKKVYAANDTRDMSGSINGDNTYAEIQRGCEAIVNTDANCQFAAASDDTTYEYTYDDTSVFTTLFPKKTTKSDDPIAVIERLNAALSENYSPAAIEDLKQQCRKTVVSCIRSVCGTDFVNCYRNRTDVMSDAYSAENNSRSGSTSNYIDKRFADSMNKVGGVLDFNIVRGLCINTITESSACDEHLKLEAYSSDEFTDDDSVWGGKSVRDAWVGAVKTGYNAKQVLDENADKVKTGCTVSDDQNGKCDSTVVYDCGAVDESGCLYDKEYYVGRTEYLVNMAADTLFQEVLGNMELEAQQIYNSKLTVEQNMCRAANNGGIMGRNDTASTYMWAKLRSKRVPKNYSVNGLKTNEFVESNDLYGSFCRARVTVQSDDPDIQRYLQNNSKNWSNAYFAVGDVFTCGSWIPQADLEEIAKQVSGQTKGTVAYDRAQEQLVKNNRSANWIAALSAVAGATGTGLLADQLQNQNLLGGLINKNVNTKTTAQRNKSFANSCVSQYTSVSSCSGTSGTSNCGAKAQSMITYATQIKGRGVSASALQTSISEVKTKCVDTSDNVSDCHAAAEALKVQCEVVAANGEYDVGAGQDNTRRWIDVGAAAVGGVGTFFLVKKAVKDSKNDALTAEQQAAYDDFMRNVGNHIYCFIGADEAGTYGDLIEISID